jgi:hypothetical protein
MVRVLKDIGIDTVTLGPSIDEPESPFDYDGVDFLALNILLGMPSWFSKLPREGWKGRPW